MKATFKWFFDLSTSDKNLQQIKVTAGGKNAVKRLANLFNAYHKYKMGAVRVTFRPAATLPVDPTGLSYDFGENKANPTDLFNPGLVRVTHGEDIVDFHASTYMYADNPTEVGKASFMKAYYTLLMDKRWRKFPLQRGFTIASTPLYWSVGNIRQETFPDFVRNGPGYGNISTGTPEYIQSELEHGSSGYTGKAQHEFGAEGFVDQSSEAGLFQTGHRQRMGWLPTTASLECELGLNGNKNSTSMFNTPPEVPLMQIITPITEKTKFFFRVYISETYYFRQPVVQNLDYNASVLGGHEAGLSENWMYPDHFMGAGYTPMVPGKSNTIFKPIASGSFKGEGLGDNDGHYAGDKQ